jgi:hypothetical protein
LHFFACRSYAVRFGVAAWFVLLHFFACRSSAVRFGVAAWFVLWHSLYIFSFIKYKLDCKKKQQQKRRKKTSK